MRDRTVALIWIGGLLLAGIAYLVGPDRFIAEAVQVLAAIQDALAPVLVHLGANAYDLIRAFALGCFAVFVALALIATARGHGVRAVLLVVSLLFLFLVWGRGPEASGHWLLAFLLAAAAALNMTRRLAPVPPTPLQP